MIKQTKQYATLDSLPNHLRSAVLNGKGKTVNVTMRKLPPVPTRRNDKDSPEFVEKRRENWRAHHGPIVGNRLISE
jgi:hypothetical protein